MAITYPLTLPTATGFRATELQPVTVVGLNASPFTGEQQLYPWPGQWWRWAISLPPMTAANAATWTAFFLKLNGPQGTFYLGPSIRKTSGGNVGGSWLVDASATANSTTLPLKSGTGLAAVGDWLQVNTGENAKLHRVVQVNESMGSMVSVDVFPRLRSAYAEDTAVSFTNPVGVFRLAELPTEAYDSRKICHGLQFTAFESL